MAAYIGLMAASPPKRALAPRLSCPEGFPSPRKRKLVDPDEVAYRTAVLVYNVSLNDMLVATQPLPEKAARQEFPHGLPGLARPLFSAQLPLAKHIAETLGEVPSLVKWPQTQTKKLIGGELATLLELGFELPQGGSPFRSGDLRFRRRADLISSQGGPLDSTAGDAASDAPNSAARAETQILAVFFPLLAVVVAAWLRGAAAEADRRVVVLTSGRAQPRDVGADAQGNSTEITADLMVRFLAAAHGQGARNLFAVSRHTDGDAFSYDANLRFCHEMLLPLLDAERGEVARRCGDAWPEHFSVTLALCDGAHSRLQVLSQCLREFRPEMAHLSPLKAFWHSCVLRPDDVDRASFARAFEAAPPTAVATLTDPALAALIAEVIAHRNSFLFAQPREGGRLQSLSNSGPADLERFWLRKSNKPVLSVLLVQREGGPLRMHRGINLEVSMPTGSLCAERNVIGTAFAADPSLRREDLRAIAVLAVDGAPTSAEGPAVQPARGRNPLIPCGACMEWLRKIHEVNPSFRVLAFEDESCQNVFVKSVGRLA